MPARVTKKERKTMISKCLMSEFIDELNRTVECASMNYKPNQPYWYDRLIWFDDVLWGLVCTDAMTVKTYTAIRTPITKFENDHGFQLLSRYNRPHRA